MKVKELVRSGFLAINLNGGVDDVKPSHRHRLMVAAGRHILDIIGSIVSTDASTKLLGGNVMAEACRIKVGQLHVRSMVPLVERKSAILELPDKNVVVTHNWSGRLFMVI